MSKEISTRLAPVKSFAGTRDNLDIEVWNNTIDPATMPVEYEPREIESGKRKVRIDPEVVFQCAKLGLSRPQIGALYGLTYKRFNDACEMYPDLEDAYAMGLSKGILKTAEALDKNIENGNVIAQIFKLKAVGGWIEQDKRKDAPKENTVNAQIYLPQKKERT